MAYSPLIKQALSIAAALALGLWLCFSATVDEAFRLISRLDGVLLITLLLTQFISYLARAGRLWHQFESELKLGFGGFLRLSLLHNLSINVMPFRAGDLLLPALLQQRGISLQSGLSTLLWLRIQDAFVLMAMAILLWPDTAIGVRVCAAISLLAAWIAGQRWLGKCTPANPRLQRIFMAVRGAIDASPNSWLWCAANWLTKLLGLTVLLAALSELSLPNAAAGALGGELSALLPIQGVAGFGTYEAGVAFMIEVAHGAGQSALASAFALHCMTLAIAIIAGSLAWFFLPSPPPIYSHVNQEQAS